MLKKVFTISACLLFLGGTRGLMEDANTEFCGASDNGTVKLENWSKGRVLVCWDGEWRGLADGSIRTTQQAKVICKQCNFLTEGRELTRLVTCRLKSE